MAMLGTAEPQPSGDQPLVSELSLLSAGHCADNWAAHGANGETWHPLCRHSSASIPPLDDEVARSWDVSQPAWRERGHQAASPQRRHEDR